MKEDDIPETALSIYNQSNEGMDDFPILRAFQQYVEREQEKSRRRITTITIVFLIVIAGLCGVFFYMIQASSMRNQTLSDRLVEYAMQEADRRAAAIQSQSPKEDASIAAISALSAKIEEMQNKMIEKLQNSPSAIESRATSPAEIEIAKAAAAQAEKAAKEIQALKAKLAAEQRKTESTPRSPSKEEIEAYRRKYYPELYEPKRSIIKEKIKDSSPIVDDEIIIDEDDAINYFDEIEDDAYTIPVEVKGSNTKWLIPSE